MKKIPSVLHVEALYARGIKSFVFIKKLVVRRAGLSLIDLDVAMIIAIDFIMNCQTAWFHTSTTVRLSLRTSLMMCRDQMIWIQRIIPVEAR